MAPSQYESNRAAFSFLVLLLVLAAANLFDISWFSSIRFAPYYPPPLVYAAIGLLLTACWTPVREGLYKAVGSLGKTLASSSRLHRFTALAAVALIFFVLTVLWSSATYLSGDAVLRLNQLDSGRWWLATEAGDFALHALWNRVISQPLGLDAAATYRWISVLSGVLFVVNAWRLSFYLNKDRAILIFLLFFTGTVALFFGYIESYALIAALLPQLVLSALKAVEVTGSKTAFVIWLVVGTIVHSVTPILFTGVFLVVLTAGLHDDRSRRQKLNRLFLILTGSGLAVLFVLRSIGLFDLPRYILGVAADGPYDISLLDAKHWQNVIGWLLLTSLPFLALLPSTSASVRKAANSPRRMLATWIMIPSLLFMLLFLPQLGGMRDWDLFSLAGWLLTLAALMLLEPSEKTEGSPGSWLIPTALMTLIVTASFVGINASMVASVDRCARTLDQSRVRNQIWEYLNLIDHAESAPVLRDRVPEFARKAWQQPPYRQIDSLNIIRRLHHNMAERGGTIDVVRSIASTLGLTYHDDAAWLLLTRYLLNTNSPQEQETLAEILAHNLSGSPRAQMYAGVINLRQNKLSLAGQQLARAYQLDSSDVDVVLNYGAFRFNSGDMPAAECLFERALGLDSTSYLACYNLALIAEREGRHKQADSLARRAMSLTAVPVQQQAAQTLLKRLGRR